jgi:hypothetical protein
MTAPERVDCIARAICAEQCAEYGEHPCHKTGPWPNEGCDEPGCMALAARVERLIPAMLAEAEQRGREAEREACATALVSAYTASGQEEGGE